jgi:hypothetical protein
MPSSQAIRPFSFKPPTPFKINLEGKSEKLSGSADSLKESYPTFGKLKDFFSQRFGKNE